MPNKHNKEITGLNNGIEINISHPLRPYIGMAML